MESQGKEGTGEARLEFRKYHDCKSVVLMVEN